MKADWNQLLQKVRRPNDARRALESFLGDEIFDDANREYNERGPASQLAKAVLCFVRPQSRVEKLIGLFESASGNDRIDLGNIVANIVGRDWFDKMCGKYLGSDDVDHKSVACNAIERWHNEGELTDEQNETAIAELSKSDDELLRETGAAMKKSRDALR